jgi:hypothetical protein
MKLVNFRHLKIGRRSRAREREEIETFINHQLTSIKDKIYLFRKDQTGRNGATKLFRVTARRSADQGGAVVPDNGVATHEIDDLD